MNAELLRTAFLEMMKGVCTSVPGHVRLFNPDLQRAQVNVGVQTVNVNGVATDLPPIADVPVLFPGGTQYLVIHQIDPGDEGMIFFSQRCIDGWKQTGGVANNPLSRFHDMHDAFFIPGFRPLPTCIPGFANDGIRMQLHDGSKYVWIKSSGEIEMNNGAGSFKLMADGRVIINEACIINTDGTIESPNVTFGGVSGNNHKHTNVQTGGGISGGPTN